MIGTGKRGALSSALLGAAKQPLITEGDGDHPLPGEAEAAAEFLVSKGAASAAAFRPSNWSYQRPANTQSPVPIPDAAAHPGEATPRAPQTTVRHRTSMRGFGVAACCSLALALSGFIFLSNGKPVPGNTPIILSPAQEKPAQAPAQTAAVITSRTRPSPPNTAALVAHGNALLGTGDIVSARLYYAQAADAGDARAAMLMGATFDPAFLGRAGAQGLRGDTAQAAWWYRRARDLGEAEAGQLLAALNLQ